MPFVEAGNVSVNFPFEPYPCQVTYMRSVISCLQNGDNGLLESPTGTGKTLCLLCSSLAWLEDKKAQIQSRRWQGPADGSDVLQQIKDQLANQLDDAAGAWNSELASPKIIYASRTHTQLSQAIQELKRTAYRHFKVSVLGSREQMCIHPHIIKQESNIAKVNLCRAKVSARTCHFYNNVEAKKATFSNQVMDIEDLVTMGKKHNCCPYYVARELKAEADIIFMPYNYLLDPKSRRAHGVELQGNIIIFDEAHNLAAMCEESASFDLTSADIGAAIQELKDLSEKMTDMIEHEEQAAQWGREPDFNLSEDFNLKDILEIKGQLHCLEQLLDRISLPKNGSGVTKPGRYIFELFGKMNVTFSNKTALSDALDKIVTHLNNESSSSFHSRGAGLSKYADVIKIIFSQDLVGYSELSEHEALVSKYYKVHLKEQEDKNSWKKKVTTWETSGPPQKKGRVLSYWCFSSGYTMCNLMRQGAKCVILTSGTLAPLDSFKAEMDIEFKVQLENPHVIESNQAWIGVVGKGPDGTTLNSSYQNRFKEEYQCSLGNAIVNFSRVVPAGVLVFFPSYPVMNKCLETWQVTNVWKRIEQYKPIFVEPRGKMEFHTAIESYYDKIQDHTANGAVFAAVCRGKVSEGLDFADNNGRAVVITGLPYPPRMDPRIMLKIQFLDEMVYQGGKGLSGDKWYKQQATRAVNQAIGRVIRHRHDFGAILLCDNRFSAPDTRDQLPAWLRPSLRVYQGFGQAMRGLVEFFKVNDVPVPGRLTKQQQVAGCVGAQFLPTPSRTLDTGHCTVVKASNVATHVDSLSHQPVDNTSAAALTRQYRVTAAGGSSVSTASRPRTLLELLAHTQKMPQEVGEEVLPSTLKQKKSVQCRSQVPHKRKIVIKAPGGRDAATVKETAPSGGKDDVTEKDRAPSGSGKERQDVVVANFLAQVKETVSSDSYRYFTKTLKSYKLNSDFEAMFTCVSTIFGTDVNNFSLYRSMYRFIKRPDRDRFSQRCFDVTGCLCGLKHKDGLTETERKQYILQETRKRQHSDPDNLFPQKKKVKTIGISGLEDVYETWKAKDPSGRVTANLKELCTQELPPSLPPVTRVTTGQAVLTSAVCSGEAGASGSTGGTDTAAPVEGPISTKRPNSIKGPPLAEGPHASTSTYGPTYAKGPTSMEGTNSDRPCVIEGPNSDRTAVIEGPNSDRPGVIEGPNSDRTAVIERPNSDRTAVIEGPNSDRPGVIEGPNSDRTAVIEGPNSDRTAVIEGPNSDRPGVIEGPNSDRPAVIERPNADRTAVTERPNSDRPGVIERPNADRPGVIGPNSDRPGVIEGPNSDRPGVTERPNSDRPGVTEGPKMSDASSESVDELPECQIRGCSRAAVRRQTGTPHDSGPSCALHQHMPVYKPDSGYICCHCKVDAYVPLKARCQHVCCLHCWKICIDESRKCPECGEKVKRRHLTRFYFHSGPNRS